MLKRVFLYLLSFLEKKIQFKNSPDKNPGWVSLNQRPTILHIVNGLSIHDNNLKWKKEFVYVVWERGDRGSLFRSLFGKAVDGSLRDITLTPEEQATFDVLTANNGETHSWEILREKILVEHGLSPVSRKGNSFLFLLFFSSLSLSCNFIQLIIPFLTVAELIEKATKPKYLESKWMKRAARTLKDPELGDRFPEFLKEVVAEEGGDVGQLKNAR